MEVNEVFSKNLKFYIIRSGKTQSQVAVDIGVSKGTLSDWCSGRSLPRMNKVQQLAEYFGVNISYLLQDRMMYTETEYAFISRAINTRPMLMELYRATQNVSDDDLEHIILLAERLGRRK